MYLEEKLSKKCPIYISNEVLPNSSLGNDNSEITLKVKIVNPKDNSYFNMYYSDLISETKHNVVFLETKDNVKELNLILTDKLTSENRETWLGENGILSLHNIDIDNDIYSLVKTPDMHFLEIIEYNPQGKIPKTSVDIIIIRYEKKELDVVTQILIFIYPDESILIYKGKNIFSINN